MRKRTILAAIVAIVFAGALGACQTASDIGDAFIGGESLDDPSTARGPALTLPPDYNLRPPIGGSGGESDSRVASQVARKRVFNLPPEAEAKASGASAVPGQPSPGERILLVRAGYASANPQIRIQVDSETEYLEQSEKQFVDKLLKWRGSPPEEEEVVSSGEGTTVEEEAIDDVPPVIIRKRRGLLDSVF